VKFRLADAPLDNGTTTPVVTPLGGGADVPVLGLAASRRYEMHAIAYGPGGETSSSTLQLSTDTLPSDLPRYVASGTDPDSGFVIFSAGKYGLAIDNTGRVVWYHHFADGAGLAFLAQPTGRYYTRLSMQLATAPAPWVEIDPLGNVTRTLGCAGGLVPRLHDLIALTDGSYWVMCDETRTMDLTAVGGVADARVTGTAIQHVASDGTPLFHWTPFDHFAIADGDPRDLVSANVNWTHGNAIDLAPDGNLIASFRNLGVVAKIDVRTGDVLWRLGGRRNEFSISGAGAPMFVGQHGARVYSPNTLLLLDNLGDAKQSLAERYTLDERALTAQKVRSYGSAPGVVTQIGGSVQALPRGHTLVSFGTAGRVEEYDSTGSVVWRIEQGAGYVFRAQRISSLYRPGAGTAR
jgi:hypothetical protein